MNRPMPRQPLPSLDLPLVGGGRFVLADNRPEAFTLLVFYRGLHCPLCKRQLLELQEKLGKFTELGVEAVAISMDSEKRAGKAREDWGLESVRIAYGLSEADARAFGLYISARVHEAEPEKFSEPGLFIVRPDGTLYGATIQTMPFTRPPFAEVIQAVEVAQQRKYPARGEVAA